VKCITDELGYQEDHTLSNMKLVLGAFGCILAVISHFYPIPFPANKHILLVCAICYFTSSGILQYIASYLQQDIILITKPDTDHKPLEVRTSMHKYDPNYTVTIKYKGGQSRSTFTKLVTEWFTNSGVLANNIFNNQVKNSLAQLAAKKEQ